jgi:hypothetical protein
MMRGKAWSARSRMKGKRFVVAQQHVVRRAEALDQLRFEQQRLGLGVGGDDRHRASG